MERRLDGETDSPDTGRYSDSQSGPSALIICVSQRSTGGQHHSDYSAAIPLPAPGGYSHTGTGPRGGGEAEPPFTYHRASLPSLVSLHHREVTLYIAANRSGGVT